MESTFNTLADYFARPDTPSANSPTGKLMVAVLEKFPDPTFEAARAKANALLNEAAGKRVYRIPVITYAIFRTFEEEWVWLVKQRA